MQFFSKLSGFAGDQNWSNKERAKDDVRRHILKAHQNGQASGHAYMLNGEGGDRIPYYHCWISPNGTIEESNVA